MKNMIYGFVVILGTLFGCSSQKNMVDVAPFTIGEGFCQKWMGGKEESGSGLLVKIPVSNIEGYKINTLFFRSQQSYINIETQEGQKFVVAKFMYENVGAPQDIVMHADPKQEFGNKPLKRTVKEDSDFPFKLANDEAVLSYIKKNKNTIEYVKVSGIKDKPALMYSSKPRE